MVIRAVASGLAQALKYPGVLFFFYATNLAVGLIVTIPLKSALKSTAGHSLLTDGLVNGLDLNLVMELFQANLGLNLSTAGLAVFLGGFYVLAGIFFSGGAFEVYRETEDRIGFWAGAGKNFWGFVRIFLWTIPFAFFVGAVVVSAELTKRLIVGSDPLQSTAFWSRMAVIAVAFLGLLFLTLVVDYARAAIVFKGDNRAGRAVWGAFSLIRKHPLRTFGFLTLLLIISGLGAFFFRWLGTTGNIASAPSYFGILIIGQIYIIFRMILRLTRYGGILHLYESFTPRKIIETQVPFGSCSEEEEPLVILET